MIWNGVAKNWAAFFAPILQRWPFVDEEALRQIDGDYGLFVEELAKTDGGSIEAAKEQIEIWLASGIPADIMMGVLDKASSPSQHINSEPSLTNPTANTHGPDADDLAERPATGL